ncbi:MAG: TIM barrel protein [Clostridia bacterium]|nr:TIM barrel protein [Clostridia bacterium]
MKTVFNLTTCPEDLDRFSDTAALLRHMEGFDGLELLCCDEDLRGVVPPERVIGVHMCYFPYWLDFWRGDTAACLAEFGTRAAMEAYYGGAGPEALLARFSRDLDAARRYGAEYLVFHVSDASIRESFTGRYRHSDETVINAACELLNALFEGLEPGPWLLLENLWQPGFRFTSPRMTERLLSGIRYPRKGVMLDTGHLMHTELSLRSEEEGLSYIHRMLDLHGPLAAHIRGLHLHQSITGDYVKSMRAAPPPEGDYQARALRMLEHAFRVDLHRPFTCPGVRALIERVAPAYLNFELISAGAGEHRRLLDEQRRALGL